MKLRVHGMRSSLYGAAIALLLTQTVFLGIGAGQQTPPEGLTAGPSAEDTSQTRTDGGDASPSTSQARLNVLHLLTQGGIIMIPIGLLSVIAVAVAIERWLALRTARVLPTPLVLELGRKSDRASHLDPREVYQLCEDFPSAASNVLKAVLLKVGRPQSELESTLVAVTQREADRLHSKVRWLNMITAVAPLLGLLGTVWGMIQAFFDLTQLPAGLNKAEFLARGIYVALVTTLGGLVVAIPSAIIAHWLEGRIVTACGRIQQLVEHLMPQWERFEGRLRLTQDVVAGDRDSSNGSESRPRRTPVSP